jgi:predicted metal-dependent hydrolase
MKPSVLTLDGLRVPVEFGGSERRARLTIEPDGSLHLLAAADVAMEELQQFLASKRKWIYTKLAKKEELQCITVQRELVSGESFQYLGRNYRLQIVEAGAGHVRLVGGRLRLPAPLVAIGTSSIVDWYKTSGAAWIAPRVKDWAERIRVEPSVLQVADLGRKWGSATADGLVRIHWASFQLKPTLIDYVVAHELAHLREPHHGPAFWQLLARAMPDYGERKNQLAHVGAQLWFGEVDAKSASPERP